MARLFESLGLFLRAPDSRPAHEIERDIQDELRFHLDECEAEELRAGRSGEEARARALQRFGDFEAIRAGCRRAQLGERIMLQRIQFALVLATLGSVGVLGWKSYASQRESEDRMRRTQATLESMHSEVAELTAELKSRPAVSNATAPAESGVRASVPAPDENDELASETWKRRFADSPDDWRAGLALAWRLAGLPPERALAILREIYPGLSLAQRQQVLKPFVFGAGSPLALAFLHLGATDPEPSIRGAAFSQLERYAFRDFSADPDAYERWHARWADAPVAEVLTANAGEFLDRLRACSPDQLARELRTFLRLDLECGEAAGIDLPGVFRARGGLELVTSWLAATNPDLQRAALRWLPALEPDRATLERLALPVLEHWQEADGNVVSEACAALGRRGNAWAVDPLVEFARASLDGPEEHRKHCWSAARALADIGDPRAVPELIGMIAADDTYDTVYGLGWFGLHELTGVTYDESHDGAWWLAWWEANRSRLSADVAALSVPRYTFER